MVITHSNADKLSRLIEQLFEYSKLEAEQISPVKEPFSITELAFDLVAKFQVLANQKEVQLKVDNPQQNLMVYADVSLVERALQNLTENALKFTEAGGVVSIQIQPTKKGNIQIDVTDTGTGIPLNEQPFIFDRFKQGQQQNRKKGGAGLGLAIVKKIMDLHETTITVLSSPKEGSRFRFQLPAYPNTALKMG